MHTVILGPSLDTESISTVARKKKMPVFVIMPLQTHWFAISLYNIWVQLQRKIAFGTQVCNVDIRGEKFALDIKTVATASTMIQNKYPNYGYGIGATPSLVKSETFFSSIFSNALNWLMKSCDDVAIIHQLPIRKKPHTHGNPDTAGVGAIRMSNNMLCETVFVSDLKNTDKEISDKESALYAKFAAINQFEHSERCLLLIGVSVVRLSATLWVYLMANKKIWAIPIVSDVLPSDMSFLATLSIGIQSLAKKPIFYNALERPIPFKDEVVTPLKINQHNRTHLKIVNGSKKVVKFFDTHDLVQLSNLEVMRFAGVEVQDYFITSDNRFLYIQYDYYDCSDEPANLAQFYNILYMLHKLHHNGYVHGDIRSSNLLFHQNGCDGYLIDYDLARLEQNGKYPPGYYHHPSIRHEDAITGLPMCKSHDRYSLAIIVNQYYPAATEVISMIRSSESLMKAAALLRPTSL